MQKLQIKTESRSPSSGQAHVLFFTHSGVLDLNSVSLRNTVVVHRCYTADCHRCLRTIFPQMDIWLFSNRRSYLGLQAISPAKYKLSVAQKLTSAKRAVLWNRVERSTEDSADLAERASHPKSPGCITLPQ